MEFVFFSSTGDFIVWVTDKIYICKLQLLSTQLEPLTEQQLSGIGNLQQSSQQAEDALSQGMEALQQSLAETLAGSLSSSGSTGNVANYMGQMAMAMGKLGTLENFLRQVLTLFSKCLNRMHISLSKDNSFKFDQTHTKSSNIMMRNKCH